ncbi:MAG: right-handed parallel beta-helix repeat-containing protein, partial [Thermoplasmata archaeon]
MFRKIVTVWVSLAIVFGFVVIVDIVTDFTPTVKAATLYVNETGSDGAYTSIQDAINASNDGDTVFVYNGTYYEHVVVNKTINLTGENRNITIIDGGGIGEVINVSQDGVNITGFSVIGGGSDFIFPQDAGIVLYDVNNCKISDNNVSSNDYCGIRIYSSNMNNISGNIVTLNYYNGIVLHSSDWNNVNNNIVTMNSYTGIQLYDSTGNEITNNMASENDIGIYLKECGGNILTGNTMVETGLFIYGWSINYWNFHDIDTTNTINGKPVYYWKNQNGGTIPLGAGQIILSNSNNINIEDQNLTNGTVGIQLAFSSDIYVNDNNVSSNKKNGIYLRVSDGNTIIDNTISSNSEEGIYLSASSANSITNNTVLNNDKGINIRVSSNDNIIIGNNVSNNDYCLYISSSSNNKIYHNNLVDNTFQAFDGTNNGNYWDNGYPLGGNYWYDYGGVDDYKGPNQDIPGRDGIGDTNYSIDSDSIDNYPLMGPYPYFPTENYTILQQGWNLISIPPIQDNQDLSKVLEMIDGYYDAVQWHDISETSDPWKHHRLGKPFGNDLFHLNETMGFWIHITQPGDTIFLYNGTQPTTNQSITLHPGWNMVGYPSLSNRNRTAALNN